MNKKTKAISEGAMFLALLGIVLMLDRYSAGMFELMLFLVSIPMVIYTMKYDISMSMTLGAAMGITGFLLGTPTAMFYLGAAAIMGIVYGYGLSKHWTNGALLSCVIFGNIMVTYITVFLFAAIFGFDIEADMRMVAAIMGNVDTAIDMNQIIWTSIVFVNLMMAIMQGFIVHAGVNILLKRMHLPYRQLKKPMDVRFPRWCGILCFFVYGLYFACVVWEVDPTIMNMVMGLYCVVLLLTLWDGILSIMHYFYKKTNHIQKGMLFVLLLMAIVPGVQNMLSMIGIMDMLLAYRSK